MSEMRQLRMGQQKPDLPKIQTLGGVERMPLEIARQLEPSGVAYGDITPQTPLMPEQREGFRLNTDMSGANNLPPTSPQPLAPMPTDVSQIERPHIANAPITENVSDPVPTVRQNLQSRMDVLNNKDYGIEKDDEGNVTRRGKDRDKEWSLGEKIGGTLLGFARGIAQGGLLGGVIGGVEGATDRNTFEKYHDMRERQRLAPRLQQAQEAEGFDMSQKQKQASVENIAADNQRQQDDLNRKIAKDANMNAYYQGLLNDKEQGRRLQEMSIEDLKAFRQWQMENGKSRTQLERDRLNESIRRTDAQIASREKIAGMNQSFTLKRDGIKAQMDIAVRQFENAMKDKRAADAEAAKARLIQLKAEYDSQ